MHLPPGQLQLNNRNNVSVFWVWYFRDNRELCTAFVESIMLSDNTLYLRITTSKHKYIRLSQPTWTVRNHCLLARSSSIVAIYFLLKFYHKILFYRLLVLVMGYFAYFWMNETTGVIRNKINMVLAYKSTPTEIVNKVLDNLSKPYIHGMTLPNESRVEIIGLHHMYKAFWCGTGTGDGWV